jgi:hypothetical protein
MGHGCPGGVLGVLPILAIAKAFKEAWKRDAGGKVVNAREDGSTDDLDDVFSLCF